MRGVFYKLLYTGESGNGTYTPGVLGGINLLVGAPRFGVIIIESHNCSISPKWVFNTQSIRDEFIENCYGDYREHRRYEEELTIKHMDDSSWNLDPTIHDVV